MRCYGNDRLTDGRNWKLKQGRLSLRAQLKKKDSGAINDHINLVLLTNKNLFGQYRQVSGIVASRGALNDNKR